ncbi:hypothetical protein ACFW9F_15015 [Streptomyces sp. NPDC059506]|uniref:hypothetical protein n=1 Tax=Streptomyces sp. NPDC059506 TaxID=3347751 RepID=UPI0036B70F4A
MPAPSAGRFLQNALHRAGIPARPDGDSGSDYIAIPVGAHGIIMIGGAIGRAKENEIHYRPSEHQGWGAVYYPDTKNDDGNFTEFYQSTNPNLAQDTAHVVKAVQDTIAGR